jgi:hypothetical protein
MPTKLPHDHPPPPVAALLPSGYPPVVRRSHPTRSMVYWFVPEHWAFVLNPQNEPAGIARALMVNTTMIERIRKEHAETGKLPALEQYLMPERTETDRAAAKALIEQSVPGRLDQDALKAVIEKAPPLRDQLSEAKEKIRELETKLEEAQANTESLMEEGQSVLAENAFLRDLLLKAL